MAFLTYVLVENTIRIIAGYCFSRLFFLGIYFWGRLVDQMIYTRDKYYIIVF